MLVESNIDLFPTSLNLTVAPERLTVDAAPVMENVRPDVPSGRLKRRLGLARVDGVVPVNSHEVVSCLAMRRGDQAVLLFDCDDAGTLRVSVNPCAAWSNADEFGGKGSAEWNENFVY